MISNKELDFWIANGLNVLFIGEHGIGKTSTILEAFNRNKLRFKYLSGATLDPWVDLIGVPKEVTDETGTRVLDLVKPKEWAHDEVDAIFIDEFNRCHKKVTNAVMELIQFKSINGKKYNNLKIIWAAVNPEDSIFQNNTYNVEPFDAAVKDRFHIHVDVPYKPSMDYMKTKFTGPVAEAAIGWWNLLPEKVKGQVSPRRLDYALDIHFKGGNLKYVLPSESNFKKLIMDLSAIPVKQTLATFFNDMDADGARDWLLNDNNYFSAADEIFSNIAMYEFFVPLFPKEKISMILAGTDQKSKAVYDLSKKHPEMKAVIDDIISSGQNKGLVETLSVMDSISNSSVKMNILAKLAYNKNNKNTTADIAHFINVMNSMSGKGSKRIIYSQESTGGRVKNIELLMKSTPDDKHLGPEAAKTALNICHSFIKRSTKSTINSITGLRDYLNYLITVLIANGATVDSIRGMAWQVTNFWLYDKGFVLYGV